MIHATGAAQQPVRLFTLLMIGLCLFIGCSSSNGEQVVGALSGIVTLDGEPLTKGNIIFYSADASAASSEISFGEYKVGGIRTGEYQVSITPLISEEDDPLLGANPLGKTKEADGTVKSEIPTKYHTAVTSGLTATVVEGNTELNFELSSQ